MIDFTQLVLAVVVVIVTTMLSLVGLQVVKILQELRKTIEKMNKVLDDTGVISESVSKPINMVSTMLMGIKGSNKIVKMIKDKVGQE